MKTNIFSAILLNVALFSCTPDPEVVVIGQPVEMIATSDSCIPLPNEPDLGWMYQVDSLDVLRPVISPSNPDELFYKVPNYNNPVEGTDILMKINLQTGKRTRLYTGEVEDNPTWSSSGWILFQRAEDRQLLKVRSDGTGLTQLTNPEEGCFDNAIWDDTGNYIHVINNELCAGGGQFILLLDSEGNRLDTLSYPSYSKCWRHNEIECSLYNTFWGLYDPLKDSVICNYSLPESITFASWPCWIGDSNFIGNFAEGILGINTDNQQCEFLKTHCNSRSYRRFSYSPQRNKVFAERIDYTFMGYPWIKSQTRIVMMNPDGTDEQMLLINPLY